MTSAEPRVLRVEVRAEPREADAFRRAIGLQVGDGTLPLTFPMRWLAAPEVRAALAAMVPEADLVPVHESQTFDYARPLRTGEAYTLTIAARRQTDPERLIVEATIAADGTVRATGETILRLFSVDKVAS